MVRPPAARPQLVPIFVLVVSALGLASATQVAAASPPFVDATATSGLDFRHTSGRDGRFLFVEMNGAGVALFDVDGDGDLDLFLPQGHPLPGPEATGQVVAPEFRGKLFRNDLKPSPGGGALRWTDVTSSSGIDARGYGMGAAAADYDGDGDVDLYLTNFGPNQLWRNRGDGTFEDVTAAAGVDEGRWSVPAVFFDFDRDGWLDLFVANYVDFTVAKHRVCPRPTGAPDYCGPLAWRAETDRLWRNRGDGTFEDVTARSGIGASASTALGALAGDFDGDGWQDLFVANDQMENFLWLNQRDGTFREEALLAGVAVNGEGRPEASMGVTAGDFDGDGDEDLFMTHIRGESHTLYRNLGDGFFDDATAATGLGSASWELTGFGTGFLDVENDGWLDLLVVDGSVRMLDGQSFGQGVDPLGQPDQFFRNRGGRGFELDPAATSELLGRREVGRGLALGDLDNDGDTDAVVFNNEGPARVWLAQAEPRGAWLGFRLLGERGSSDALGARLEILRREKPRLVRWVRAHGSYASSHDPRVLVGLGEATEVSGVRVVWPEGQAEYFEVETLERYHTLRRGEGRQEPPSDSPRDESRESSR